MCTFQRRKYFERQVIVDAVRDQLLRTAAAYDVAIPAYCFMPDHLHALLEGSSPTANLQKCAQMFRQRSGHHHRSTSDGERLWQEGYYDRVLRSDDASIDVARYIVANPVRAGLRADVRSFPYVGSTRYTIDELTASTA